jgi:N-methylhydantoinase A
LAQIGESIEQFSKRLRGKGLSRFQVEYFVEARYPYQVWELEVALARGRFEGPEDLKRMLDAFHAEHERVFAVKEPEQQIECVYWRGRLTALLEAPPLRREELAASVKPVARVKRQAYFSDIGKRETPRYLGKDLCAGMVIEGPAIIDEPTTTVVVYPETTATVTPLRNYLLEIR